MKHSLLKIALVLLSLILPNLAVAHEFKIGEIEIGHPYARAMLPGAKVGGGYLKLTNNGADDRLIGVTTDRAGTVQLHEMKMDGGIMVMRELKQGVDLPANTTVELKPGGFHLMFMNVSRPFKEGETIKATLTFEKAGSVDVELAVGPPAGAAATHTDHAQ
ncbi:copper chaperone PCu(A)C [Pararhizobium arenae]|uniref:copper chaperone PCu(A)C n=1 Tax=Pararhizobium arenae TaxID=1856850 RepID=UPI00094B5E6F|nr:copper chaperone PCu(A)C [Pararhizobium arenae]